MPDVFTKAKRSEVMSRIRSRGNARTELALVRVFRAHGLTGWRRHLKLRVGELRVDGGEAKQRGGLRSVQRSTRARQLTVRPDFVFHKPRTVVFVDGCFWHGCPQHGTKPRGNAAFWRKKFAANIARDQLVTGALRRAGWKVLRIWEHELARKWEARLVARLNRCFGPTGRRVPRPTASSLKTSGSAPVSRGQSSRRPVPRR